MTKTSGLILNTFDELEDSCIYHVSSACNNLYTVGPLHAHINSKLGDRARTIASHGSLYSVEEKCLEWLDSQPPKSVLYVSFGSITQTSLSQLMEFWHGLVNSGQPFLWVIRPGAVIGEEGNEGIPEDLLPGPKERGYVVEWAPQEQVLAHHALGAFLTHSGWGSVLESIVAKIPMICWPYMGDHYINTQCVTKVWEIGVELEAWDRSTVEKAIKSVMETKKEDFQISMDKVAKLAEDTISKGGSSSQNLDKLVEDIRKIKATA
nr:7-deoxyloganetic acid glucosyltransferase-like isoform X1 [Ziziphus jujuba var. spinosa]XP_048319656.1 7-deoxyloganetic acid glucosyltransferase-like isoform X1 [Ziziphus jujuba var. spinosa]XP_048319657.1 7-deoxyloganetic acid glucosyltransferase-like isoform X1 [Ziziphus jujuba var. spinosa]